MSKYMYDVIVVGGGTAGLGAYRKAASLGKKSLIIEAQDFVTTCANVGCMPSKLLIAAGESVHEINKAHLFGINVDSYKIDEKAVMERVRRERDRFVGFVRRGAQNIAEDSRIIGYAKFVGPNTIEVNGKKLTAKSFVIATGSTPIIPDIFNSIRSEILTNENVFELTSIPKTIAVFGAGVIGLELGFAFHNLGAKVTLFNRSDKILRLNSKLNDYMVTNIKDSFDFIHETPVKSVEKIHDKYKIKYGEHSLEVDKILVATGRLANLNQLNLEALGLTPLEALAQYSSETTQIGNRGLFLAGDVNNDAPILHEAASEGLIAGQNASLYPKIKKNKRTTALAIVFSQPQVMSVGKTSNLPLDTITGEVSFEDQGRSRVMLKNKGLLEVYFEPVSRLLIGAQMIGPSAEHVAHLLAWSIEKKSTIEELLSMPYYHPVIEEGVRTAMREAKVKFDNLGTVNEI